MPLMLNEDAILELSRQVSVEDISTSSFWQQELINFKYENGSFSGANGAEGHSPPLNMIRSMVRNLLLIPFWVMGMRFSNFRKFSSKLFFVRKLS